MKKILGISTLCILFAAGCKKVSDSDVTATDDQATTPEVALTHRTCASQDVLMAQLAADPDLALRMQAIENVTAAYTADHPDSYLSNGIVYIPVVVNVVYSTSAQNISQAQIQSQIDVLNADYAGTNSDINKVPSNFTGVKAGDTHIRFILDKVVRRQTSKSSFTTNDAMKKAATGIAPTSPTTKLNMWSCNLSGGVLGYAQFPGGNSATDGVVIDDNAFGVTTAGAPYNKGRTATHEVGHWLNLRHIWGDANCGNDLVADTPLHNGANFGCPAANSRSTCSGNPIMMTMNYMDYTDDLCMYMFTLGQSTRMNATFSAGGGRTGFAGAQ